MRPSSNSPGVPTRYLFARGLLELHEGKLEAARATATEIEGHALPADDPDSTEDKAAAFLRGSALLAEGEAAEALAELSRAVALSGYDYAVYRLGWRAPTSLPTVCPRPWRRRGKAAAAGDPADPRFDLELDRVRAELVLAQVRAAMGRGPKAVSNRPRVSSRAMAGADPGLPEISMAKKSRAAPTRHRPQVTVEWFVSAGRR